jgi:hypothetical protein
MDGMMLHRGGQEVSRMDLDMILVPEATDTYQPVSHYHLADKLLTISQDILRDYVLVGEQFGIARQGNQLFALLRFKKEGEPLGLSVAFRNSYDKSMSLGLAIGANVFVCDNLALHGDITVMKKHTKNVWTTLEDLAIATLYKATRQHQLIQADASHMNGIPMDDFEAFSTLGVLFGEEVVSPRQMSVVRQEWLTPSYTEFQTRNVWSFYNACTEALKSCPPISIMEKHTALHSQIMQLI